jgi:putative transcriptional regulator
MCKAKRNVGQEILDGLRELKRGEVSRVINVPDVATIRENTGLSQSRFAALLGLSVRTLQDWEQGRRVPKERAPLREGGGPSSRVGAWEVESVAGVGQ